jgi:coatomer subunit beta
LKSVYDQISNFDELLQLAIIDFIRKNSKTNTNDRAKYIRIIFDLLNASSQSVKYEAANSLITLTTNATAIKGNIHI